MDVLELSGRRFTTSAIRVVEHIAERASDRGMLASELTEATAGMLAVLSILRWERKVARAALEQLGIDLDRLAREIDDAIRVEGETSRNPTGPQLGVHESDSRYLFVDLDSPRRPLLNQAEHEALALQHGYVGSEHILLAAVRFACPRFREILDRHLVTADRIRDVVLELLRPDSDEV
jgi:ATP-dependent Clp protease ATP-binding subunit ClpA